MISSTAYNPAPTETTYKAYILHESHTSRGCYTWHDEGVKYIVKSKRGIWRNWEDEQAKTV